MSDGCGGQNRNYPMARFNMFAVNAMANIHSVNMLFLESGHSYLPNDRDFGVIAKAMKHREAIYTPDDYQQLVTSCKKKNPFTVKDVKEFVIFSDLDKVLIKRKKNEGKEQVRWLKIRWLQFEKGSLKMKYKYSSHVDEDFQCVDLCRKKRQTREALSAIQSFQPQQVCQEHQISQAKFADLQKLLQYVPPTYHQFFNELPYEETSSKEEHPDISDSDTEDYIEGHPEESICD